MKTKLTLTLGLLACTLCLPMFAQNSVVTYQGRVTSNGTNFNGSGEFKAALVTVTNNSHTATATANPPSGGFVTVINVTSGGSGYVTPPPVTITGGGGSGATATAAISGGVVTGITVNNPGNGYSSTPAVLLSDPPESLIFATYWSNDGTSSAGSEPAAAVSATVANGLFTLRLGDPTVANMTALNAGLFQQPDLHLRLWFNNGVSGFAVLNPTQPLTTAPYAALASVANVAKTLTTAGNQPVNLSVNGTNVLRITLVNDFSFGTTANSVGGSPANVISNGFVGGFIGGGGSANYPNRVGANYASVLGGLNNTASGYVSTAMGRGTTASGNYSTAMGYLTTSGSGATAMGYSTTASGYASTAMGYFTTASGYASTAMGNETSASGSSSTAMGYSTVASGNYSTAMGNYTSASGFISTAMGNYTTAGGDYSTAMGNRAKANHNGSFVWADSQAADFASTAANQLSLRASGGYRLFSDAGATAGVSLAADGTAWAVISDRNVKKDFAAVDSMAILEKLAAMPITQWHYKWEEEGITPHIGPMAQDFKAAFYSGTDDKSITTAEADGVALAAIQGLNEKVEVRSQNAEVSIRALRTENAELKAAVNELKELVQTMNAKLNGGAK